MTANHNPSSIVGKNIAVHFSIKKDKLLYHEMSVRATKESILCCERAENMV